LNRALSRFRLPITTLKRTLVPFRKERAAEPAFPKVLISAHSYAEWVACNVSLRSERTESLRTRFVNRDSRYSQMGNHFYRFI